MSAAVRKFAAEMLTELKRASDDEVLALKRDIAEYALVGVTNRMPVLTGQARANTVVSKVTPHKEWEKSTDPLGTVTIAKGQAVIDSDIDPYKPIYINNNVPYFEKLEAGFSGKAPLGMFAITVAEIEAIYG